MNGFLSGEVNIKAEISHVAWHMSPRDQVYPVNQIISISWVLFIYVPVINIYPYVNILFLFQLNYMEAEEDEEYFLMSLAFRTISGI